MEAAEREVTGTEQQLKEAMRRLTINQERSALASIEEREALVCQELGGQRGEEGGHEAAEGQKGRAVGLCQEGCGRSRCEGC